MSDGEQSKQMKDLACILHSTYFGVLQALRKEKGLFAIYELSIKGIDETLKAYFNFLGDKSVPEIIAHLEGTGIYKDIVIKREGNGYMLDIGKCLFASGSEGVHNSISDIDMPCPIALFICSCLAKENPTKKLYIYPSIYDEEGVTTQIDLLSPEEYAKKMDDLNKIAKIGS